MIPSIRPLSTEHLRDLYVAAVRAGLTAHREALLAGIDRPIVASLPVADDPTAQILSDLFRLADLRRNDGRVDALIIWLRNAVALVHADPLRSVFEDALEHLSSGSVLDSLLEAPMEAKPAAKVETAVPAREDPRPQQPGFGGPLEQQGFGSPAQDPLGDTADGRPMVAGTAYVEARAAPQRPQAGLGALAASGFEFAATAVGAARARLGPRAELEAPAVPAEPPAAAQRRLPPAPPWVTAYRPSWIQPRVQSSIYVYVFLPEVKRAIEDEARSALDTPGNRARGAHALPLYRALGAGELLTADVELEGFKVGRAEPVAWSPPYVRFVISLLAQEGVAIGTHRPIVSVRTHPVDGAGELLARLDFDIEVRAGGRGRSLARVGLMSGGLGIAVALATAVQQHALPSLVGLSAGAVCVAGGVGAWVAMRPPMDRAGVRDVSNVFVSYAREDLDRVRQAVSLLRAAGHFPWIDVDQLLGGDRWKDRLVDAIDRADRFFLFWSRHAGASRWVTEEWQRALARAQREASFIVPVMLDAERPGDSHPLARFQYVFLDGQVAPTPRR